ncbi:hypothetical protein RIU21_07230 [Riemerella anatipestifer]|uniref:hypothetical protein n=1 Tax=Riemerella anatipestifer TaxID=34085 RepID=UPI002856C228|nr:hypothetical protein [Riemerella anatipestifer]MDR7846557.1 hypothetical protein [Riemerella anatipestifer]
MIQNYLKIKTPTLRELKAREKEEKRKLKELENKRGFCISKMDDETFKKVAHRLTMIAYSTEFLSEQIDELLDMGVIHSKSLVVDFQNELLKLIEVFIGMAMEKGEAAELQRIAQQKGYDELIRTIGSLNAKQYEALLNFTKTIKIVKK